MSPVGEYRDDGVSGTVDFAERAGGGKLLRDAASGLFDAVCVYDTSRLGRDDYAVITPLTVARLRSLGIAVHTTTGPLADTPESNLMLSIHSGINSYYRNEFKRKSQDGKRRAVQQGLYIGRRPPYGYQVVERRLAIREDTAAVVRRIYRVVAGGGTATAVAAQLTAEGIPSPNTGGAWYNSVTTEILHARLYLGELTHRIGGEVIVTTIPALIDPDTWERAQAQLAANKRRRVSVGRVYPLRGVLRCGACGRALYAYTTAVIDGKRRYAYYVCGWRGAAGESCPERTHYPAAELEAAVWQDVLQTVGNPRETVRRAAERLLRDSADPGADLRERDRLRTALAEKPGERDLILTRLRRRLIDDAAADRQLTQIAAEERALRQALQDVEGRLAGRRQEADLRREVETLLRDVGPLISANTPASEQAELIRRLIARVTLHPDGRLHIEYTF